MLAILRAGQGELAGALAKYAGKVEVDLAATWGDLTEVLTEIAADKAVLAAKARLGGQIPATKAQCIELGQLVKELLDQKNKTVADRLLFALRTKWPNIVVNPGRDDSAVLNAAVLIDHAQEAEFDRVLDQLDQRYDSRIHFRRVGPLPPYSFATAEVRSIPTSGLDEARRTLGLGQSASLTEIKAAHRRLLQKLHPDRNSDMRAAEELSEVSAAYALLEDYASNFKHAFMGQCDEPVIVTVRSLEDLRVSVSASRGRDSLHRRDCVGFEAA